MPFFRFSGLLIVTSLDYDKSIIFFWDRRANCIRDSLPQPILSRHATRSPLKAPQTKLKHLIFCFALATQNSDYPDLESGRLLEVGAYSRLSAYQIFTIFSKSEYVYFATKQ